MAGYENRKGKNPPERKAREGGKLSQLAERRRTRGTGEVADWGGANGALIVRAIGVITKRGWNIQFGYTSDGGSYALRLFDGTEASTDYVRPTEDLDAYLTSLIDDIENS